MYNLTYLTTRIYIFMQDYKIMIFVEFIYFCICLYYTFVKNINIREYTGKYNALY